MGNKELYIKAMGLIGKDQMEKKQKAFLLRVIQKAEQEAQNINAEEWKRNQALRIISDLNKTCMTHFRDSTETYKLIYSRMAAGYSEEDFYKVHRIKADQWLADGQMVKYLRPSTLYATRNFESYLNEAHVKERISKTEEPKRWQDFESIQELIDHRKGVEVPIAIKELYGYYNLMKERGNKEKMQSIEKEYQEKRNV